MNTQIEAIRRLLSLIITHQTTEDGLNELAALGILGDLLRAKSSMVNRKELRRAIGLMPFNTLGCVLSGRAELQSVGLSSENDLRALSGHRGTPLEAVPGTFEMIASASWEDDVKPKHYYLEGCLGRIYGDAEFSRADRPHDELAEEMRRDGFRPADLGDIARMSSAEQAERTSPLWEMWIASPAPTTGPKEDERYFFVASPWNDAAASRTLHLMTWPEIIALSNHQTVGFLGTPKD